MPLKGHVLVEVSSCLDLGGDSHTVHHNDITAVLSLTHTVSVQRARTHTIWEIIIGKPMHAVADVVQVSLWRSGRCEHVVSINQGSLVDVINELGFINLETR